jgi:hypothetical protein
LLFSAWKKKNTLPEESAADLRLGNRWSILPLIALLQSFPIS